jgi:hypothetical protein
MSMGFDKSKFKFSETFNNGDGKTSGSGFIGVLMGMIVIIGFLSGLVGWWAGKPQVLEILDKVLQLGLLAAGLLGVRKLSGVLTAGKNGVGVEQSSESDDKKTV